MSSRITRTQLADGIYLLRFNTQYELASTFLRIQEHYESRRFSGRVFSLEKFMDWYAAEFGQFSYYEDWSGFNVPSTALEPFRDGKFAPLLEKEKRLLRIFRYDKEPFYVVGMVRGATKRDLIHELAHALYYSHAPYRRAVRAAMKEYKTLAMERKLYKMGYAKHVIMDEVHAYLVAPGGSLSGRTHALAPLRKTLRALFRKHSRRLSVPALNRA